MLSHFEVNMRNHSQDIMLKQFHQQLTVSQDKQTLLSNTFMEKNI